MLGVVSNAIDIYLFLMIYPHMSLHYKVVPVQYQEYKYGLLTKFFFSDKGLSLLFKNQTDLELIHLKSGSTHTHLSDKCLTVLRSPKLISVKLEGLDQLTNNAVITLAKNCTNICELMLPRCSGLTDGCIQTITTLLSGKLVSSVMCH